MEPSTLLLAPVKRVCPYRMPMSAPVASARVSTEDWNAEEQGRLSGRQPEPEHDRHRNWKVDFAHRGA